MSEQTVMTVEVSEYAWSKFHRVLNMPLVLNVPGLEMWWGCEYAKVTDDPEYFWICVNNASVCVNMPWYLWICLNIPEYTWVIRVLNMPKF